MPRISGTDIPEKKRIDIALTYVFGLGRNNVYGVLEHAKIDPARRTGTLSHEEMARLQKLVDTMKVAGDLRREISGNITRLKEIGSYRGKRHAKGLPAHGQRTRTNARTKRGKRVTIGALKKEAMAQKDTAAKEKEKK